MAAVHDHNGKRVRTMILFQVLTLMPTALGAIAAGICLVPLEKRYGRGSSPAIRMTGEKNPFLDRYTISFRSVLAPRQVLQ